MGKMLKYLTLFGVASLALAQTGTGTGYGSGEPWNGMDDGRATELVLMMCTAQAPTFSESSYVAMNACSSGYGAMATGRKGKGKGKGKGKQTNQAQECPSVDEVANYAMDMFGDDLCWLMEMNWLDMEYNFNETKYAEDVMELPATVSAALMDE